MMKPRCDWCASVASYRVIWTGTALPPHERPAVCTNCTVHPVRVLAAIGIATSFIVLDAAEEPNKLTRLSRYIGTRAEAEADREFHSSIHNTLKGN